jgi:hypothetical protein
MDTTETYYSDQDNLIRTIPNNKKEIETGNGGWAMKNSS